MGSDSLLQRSALKDFKPVPERLRRPSTSASVSGASTSAVSTSVTQVDSIADDDMADADPDSAEATYINTQFWNFVDDELEKVRQASEQLKQGRRSG
jgi:hypothetical protein